MNEEIHRKNLRRLEYRRRVLKAKDCQKPSLDSKKTCLKCFETKLLVEFHVNRANKDGRETRCKECLRKTSRERYHIPEVRLKSMLRNRARYKSRKAEYTKYKKEWNKKNPEKRKESSRRYINKKKSTPQGYLEVNLMTDIRKSIFRNRYGGPTKWEKVLGWSFEDLRRHLESQFTEGMNWGKVMNGEIQIDHILPRSSFYYETVEDEDFKSCWAITNLRPLWVDDNKRKGDKMPDGSDGRLIGAKKRLLLKEDLYIAGFENQKSCDMGLPD